MENCKLGLATIKKDRADEGSTKLMEDQTREKEVALARLLQLEGLDQKQKLEFEIAQLKDKLRVIEHYLHGEEDIYKFIDKIHKKGEEEKKGLEELLDTLLMDLKANQKLSEVRAELIEGLTKMLKGRALIGIKRIDDLHIKPFELECKNFSSENADSKALELCSSSDKICNPSWRPSKTTECDGHFEHFWSEDLPHQTIGRGSSTSQKAKERADHLILSQSFQTDLALTVEPTTSSQPIVTPTSSNSNSSSDELFLWPWVGLLVNLPMEDEDVFLKDQFSEFNPINVIASPERDLVTRKGEAVILFNMDSKGFKDAMAFENHFKLKRMGKNEWYDKKGLNLIGIHGWIARDDDYKTGGLFAKILRKHGKMKTVVDVMEEAKENVMTVASLVKKMNVMDKYLQELKFSYNETVISLENMMDSKAKISHKYNEEMHNVKQKGRENARRNLLENDKLKLELGAKKNKIEQCCRELKNYEIKIEGVKRNLDVEKDKVHVGSVIYSTFVQVQLLDFVEASLYLYEAALVDSYLALAHIEKKSYDEKVKEHMEEHKREMEVALTRVRQLEMELDQKQKMELEITHLKGKLKVMEHLQGEEDIDNKIAEYHNKLEQEKEHLEELHNTLFLKEREANQELNEARAELIQNFEGLTKFLQVPFFIGIKRMGDLDIKPFESACKKSFLQASVKTSVLCSSWDAQIRDPLWHPFKFIKRDGVNEEVIDQDDPKLKSLWTNFGDDVYNAVKKALLEINEYNPSGRYPVAELWNRKEDRKVEMKEAIHYFIKQYKTRR
ncbi:LOW QUALITY PROTEIN: factor of DNA methylation 5-like [Phalaenopsis equestris]|uniref:LOW QUALITY PROTEIN: factor of DNA methylation 5-like n=1 Tax=Phalaenopsis equestris TaxID=78828 RepID=UPI0009E5D44F|nr:LOW QUALITY PROTEIN: factor of DNA methylation 5-like [Phalaenopsis equestris]